MSKLSYGSDVQPAAGMTVSMMRSLSCNGAKHCRLSYWTQLKNSAATATYLGTYTNARILQGDII